MHAAEDGEMKGGLDGDFFFFFVFIQDFIIVSFIRNSKDFGLSSIKTSSEIHPEQV